MNSSDPKVFISYSWSSEAHKAWVLKLATDLRNQGVDILLDRWALKEGMDKYHFMESCITNPDIQKILIISDKIYAEKSNSRTGGVGTEAEIISSELYNKVDQVKFAAVVTQKNESGIEYIPTMLKNRIFFDMSIDEDYYKKIEEILRWIFDEPILVKPPIGKRPNFSVEPNAKAVDASFRRLIESFKSGATTTSYHIVTYYENFKTDYLEFRTRISNANSYDAMSEELNIIAPLRDEFIEVLDHILISKNAEWFAEFEKVFFEIASFMSVNNNNMNVGPYTDSFDFFVYELFLHSLSRILKKEKFEYAESFLSQRYARNSAMNKKSVGFQIFRSYPKLVEEWNAKKEAKLLSPQGEMIFSRSKLSRASFEDIALADLVLYFRDLFYAFREKERQTWYSHTLLYADIENIQFGLAVRAESAKYLPLMLKLFGAVSKQDFESVVQCFKDHKLYVPTYGFRQADIFGLSNYKNWGIV